MKRQCRAFVLLWSCLALLSCPAQAPAADPVANPKATEKLVDAYVTAMTMAYPPAGAALSAAKGMMSSLGWFNSPDLVAEALKLINQRLSALETRMDKLENEVAQVKSEVFRNANLERIRELRSHRGKLQGILFRLQQKPTEKDTKIALAHDAQIVAESFLDDKDLWMWSDLSLKTHTWAGQTVKEGQMIAPDFKPLPAMEYYTLALVTWMAAMEYAGEGNTAFVKATYGTELQKHIDFLSVRPAWDEQMDTPETLPEHVKSRVRASYHIYRLADQGTCFILEYTRDSMARQVKDAATLRGPVPDGTGRCITPDWLTTAPLTAAEKARGMVRHYQATPAEEELESTYGTDLMWTLAQSLTRLKTNGTVREQFIGAFAPPGATVVPAFIYGIEPSGRMQWYRHDGATQGVGAEQPGAWKGASLVSPPTGGWGDFKQVLPGGGNVIYAITQDGKFIWFRHGGFNTGARREWEGPSDVGAHWARFKHVFSGGSDIVYAITQEGKLLWYKHTGHANGGRIWAPEKEIGSGWGHFKHVFSGGEGIIYAITYEGKLIWYHHVGYADGSFNWNGPREIKTVGTESWADYKHVFSAGTRLTGNSTRDTILIYAITPDGRLFWYEHQGYRYGPRFLKDRKQIGHGWGEFKSVFALLPGTPDVVR